MGRRRGGMRELLILGTLPRARRAQLAALGDGWCVVSTSPWLSAQLDAAGIRHRRPRDYCPPPSWPPRHAATARRLARLARRGPVRPEPAWLDDWSHLLVDELAPSLFWAAAARRLSGDERPRAIHVQRLGAHPAAAAVAGLARGFAALGWTCHIWTPARRR